MQILVTGGAGFLGSVVTNKLLNDHHDVIVVDNLMYGDEQHIDKRAKYFCLDVRDKKTWRKLEKYQFDIVFHFASPSSIILFKQDFSDCMNNTIQGFINAVDFCSKKKIKLVYPSTGSLYSGVLEAQKEDVNLHYDVLNEYALGKNVLEKIAFAYKNDVDITAFRIFATYGENEFHKGEFASIVYLFAKDIINDKQPVIWGDGTQTRDFIYQDDVAKCIVELSLSNNTLINLGSGISVSFNDIIKIINEITDKNIKPIYVDKPINYLESTKADISFLKKLYYNDDSKYKFTSIYDGIKKMIESMYETRNYNS